MWNVCHPWLIYKATLVKLAQFVISHVCLFVLCFMLFWTELWILASLCLIYNIYVLFGYSRALGWCGITFISGLGVKDRPDCSHWICWGWMVSSIYMVLLEVPHRLWSVPSRRIVAFVLLSLQPPTPSLCWLWRDGINPTLPRDTACVVLIKLGQPSPYKQVLWGWVKPNPKL